MQQRRDPLYNFKSNKPRQHEDKQTINQSCTHIFVTCSSLRFLRLKGFDASRVPHPCRTLCVRVRDFDLGRLPHPSPFLRGVGTLTLHPVCATKLGNPNASLTRAFTTSP